MFLHSHPSGKRVSTLIGPATSSAHSWPISYLDGGMPSDDWLRPGLSADPWLVGVHGGWKDPNELGAIRAFP